MTGLVILDRDGVINDLVSRGVGEPHESPLSVEVVRLRPRVGIELEKLTAAGLRLACVTNQPAAAKGEATIDKLQAVHERVMELLSASGVTFDSERICWHHPQGQGPLAHACDCRKPAPGMLLSVARELRIQPSDSWMIGDTDADIQAAEAAGMRSILVTLPESNHKRGCSEPDWVASDLEEAVSIVISNTWPI